MTFQKDSKKEIERVRGLRKRDYKMGKRKRGERFGGQRIFLEEDRGREEGWASANW